MKGISRRARTAATIVLTICLLVCLPLPTSADTFKVKVGERIDTKDGSPPKSAQGTVKEIGTGDKSGTIRVKFDYQTADAPGLWIRPSNYPHMVRLGANGKAVPGKPEPTAPAQRAPLPAPAQAKTRNGAKPSPALLRKLIQSYLESATTDSAVVNVDIHSLEVGTPRKWRARDLGTGEIDVTIIHPAHVTWTSRSYRQSGVSIAEYDGVLNCYVNAFGKWQTGIGESKVVGAIKRIEK